MTQAEYDDSGKYSSSAIREKFGSWFAALEAAGLEKTRNLGITNEEYFRNLEKVWRTLGRQPVGPDMRKPLSKYSVDAYADRFGTWRKALEAFVEYVNSEASSSATTTKSNATCVERQLTQTPEFHERAAMYLGDFVFLLCDVMVSDVATVAQSGNGTGNYSAHRPQQGLVERRAN